MSLHEVEAKDCLMLGFFEYQECPGDIQHTQYHMRNMISFPDGLRCGAIEQPHAYGLREVLGGQTPVSEPVMCEEAVGGSAIEQGGAGIALIGNRIK